MKFKKVEVNEKNADIVFVALVQTVSLLAHRDGDFILMERIELADYPAAMELVSDLNTRAEREFIDLHERYLTMSDGDGLATQIEIQMVMAKQRELRMLLDTFDAYVAVAGEPPAQSLSNLMRGVDAKQKASMN